MHAGGVVRTSKKFNMLSNWYRLSRYYCFRPGLVSSTRAVRRTRLSTVRRRRAADAMVQAVRADWNAEQHVGDLAHLLHARRTAVCDLQQSGRLHGRQKELLVYKSTWTGTSHQRQGTWGSVSTDDCLEGWVCRVSDKHSPTALGRITDGQSSVLELPFRHILVQGVYARPNFFKMLRRKGF